MARKTKTATTDCSCSRGGNAATCECRETRPAVYEVRRTGKTWGVFKGAELVEGGFFERDFADKCRAEWAAAAAKPATPDFTIRDEGTIVLFWSNTPGAVAWWAEHVNDDAPTFGGGHVVEHRYAWDIFVGLKQAGFTTSTTSARG